MDQSRDKVDGDGAGNVSTARPRRFRRLVHSEWTRVIVGDLMLALILGIVLVQYADRSEDRRAARAERLENLRFMRALSAPEDRNRPFVGIDVSGLSLSGLELPGADFRMADLSDADLKSVDLTRATLGATNFAGANLSAANLEGVVDTSSTMEASTDFSGATMFGVYMVDCYLDTAIFRGATLEGANLSNCSLTFADFTAANLNGVWFQGANLTGADLTGANINPADLPELFEGVVYDDQTTWPEGITPPPSS